jgi:hypothetical protein
VRKRTADSELCLESFIVRFRGFAAAFISASFTVYPHRRMSAYPWVSLCTDFLERTSRHLFPVASHRQCLLAFGRFTIVRTGVLSTIDHIVERWYALVMTGLLKPLGVLLTEFRSTSLDGMPLRSNDSCLLKSLRKAGRGWKDRNS